MKETYRTLSVKKDTLKQIKQEALNRNQTMIEFVNFVFEDFFKKQKNRNTKEAIDN